MPDRFAIGCHHLAHPAMYRFTRQDGSRLRPFALTCDEGDELIIEAHNRIVTKGATVYFLGDVAIRATGLKLLSRMNGRKILIRGNHDIFKMKQYVEHFADIRGTHKIDRLIFSHYPLHRESIPHWSDGNVHAHTHDRPVMMAGNSDEQVRDPLYFNACLDFIGLEPLAVEEIAACMSSNRYRGQPSGDCSNQERNDDHLRDPMLL